jgi:hypothetical protein
MAFTILPFQSHPVRTLWLSGPLVSMPHILTGLSLGELLRQALPRFWLHGIFQCHNRLGDLVAFGRSFQSQSPNVWCNRTCHSICNLMYFVAMLDPTYDYFPLILFSL